MFLPLKTYNSVGCEILSKFLIDSISMPN